MRRETLPSGSCRNSTSESEDRISVGILTSMPLADFAGAGASVPLLGFGHLLAQGVQNAVDECGLPGAFTGGLTAASGGIAASLIFGVLAALVGKSKDQN